jgi:hypothetical protein
MKIFYNLNQIVSIEVYPERISQRYKYKKEGLLRPSGVFDNVGRLIHSDYSTMSGAILRDDVLYIKPECRLIFSMVEKEIFGDRNVTKSYFFDTYEEALAKAEEMKKLAGIWI